jgi:hypothetical protein
MGLDAVPTFSGEPQSMATCARAQRTTVFQGGQTAVIPPVRTLFVLAVVGVNEVRVPVPLLDGLGELVTRVRGRLPIGNVSERDEGGDLQLPGQDVVDLFAVTDLSIIAEQTSIHVWVLQSHDT